MHESRYVVKQIFLFQQNLFQKHQVALSQHRRLYRCR